MEPGFRTSALRATNDSTNPFLSVLSRQRLSGAVDARRDVLPGQPQRLSRCRRDARRFGHGPGRPACAPRRRAHTAVNGPLTYRPGDGVWPPAPCLVRQSGPAAARTTLVPPAHHKPLHTHPTGRLLLRRAPPAGQYDPSPQRRTLRVRPCPGDPLQLSDLRRILARVLRSVNAANRGVRGDG
jgi:hypothetical protein